MPTLLEAQYAQLSTQPDYGSAPEGVALFDLDTGKIVTPQEARLSADLPSIGDFMVSRRADPEHVRYTTVVLYQPGSIRAAELGASKTTGGWVSGGLNCSGEVSGIESISGDCGLRFPLIFLEHDKDDPAPAILNKRLRHEIDHLGDEVRLQPYNNNRLIRRLKRVSSAVGALATPSVAGMWDRAATLHSAALPAGTTALEYGAVVVACSLTAIGAVGMRYGLARHEEPVMHALSPVERRADFFSYRTRHFQPFSEAG